MLNNNSTRDPHCCSCNQEKIHYLNLQTHMAAEYIIGGVSSMVAEVTTLPFDVIKVRMQLDKGLTFYETCRNLIKEGGISALFIGLQPALLRQVFYGTIRYGLYPPVKKYLSGGHFDYDNLVLNHLLAGKSY